MTQDSHQHSIYNYYKILTIPHIVKYTLVAYFIPTSLYLLIFSPYIAPAPFLYSLWLLACSLYLWICCFFVIFTSLLFPLWLHIEGTYLNITKAIYDRPAVNITLKVEKLKAFLLRSGIRQVSTLTTVIQHVLGSPSHSNQRRKRNIGTQFGKEYLKLSLFADDMILLIEF